MYYENKFKRKMCNQKNECKFKWKYKYVNPTKKKKNKQEIENFNSKLEREKFPTIK